MTPRERAKQVVIGIWSVSEKVQIDRIEQAITAAIEAANADLLQEVYELRKYDQELTNAAQVLSETAGLNVGNLCVTETIKLAIEDGRKKWKLAIEALEFYANPTHWSETEEGVITVDEPLGAQTHIHLVFIGETDKAGWEGHPSQVAVKTLEQICSKETL